MFSLILSLHPLHPPVTRPPIRKPRKMSIPIDPCWEVVPDSTAASSLPISAEDGVFAIEMETEIKRRSSTDSDCNSLVNVRSRGTRTRSTTKQLREMKEEKKGGHGFRCEDVMDYAVETYFWKRSLEECYKPQDCAPLQIDITANMRQTVLIWLARVCRVLSMSLETFCLTVNYLDRYLCIQPLDRDILQLAGLTALLIASKQEESVPLKIRDLLMLCEGSYTPVNFRNMEWIMLRELNFYLTAPTSAFILQLLVEVMDIENWPFQYPTDLTRHLIEMVLCDSRLSKLNPSEIAHSLFDFIQDCDSTAVKSVSLVCPKCEPQKCNEGDQDFIDDCFKRLSAFLIN